jgi:hypothetical protein
MLDQNRSNVITDQMQSLNIISLFATEMTQFPLLQRRRNSLASFGGGDAFTRGRFSVVNGGDSFAGEGFVGRGAVFW